MLINERIYRQCMFLRSRRDFQGNRRDDHRRWIEGRCIVHFVDIGMVRRGRCNLKSKYGQSCPSLLTVLSMDRHSTSTWHRPHSIWNRLPRGERSHSDTHLILSEKLKIISRDDRRTTTTTAAVARTFELFCGMQNIVGRCRVFIGRTADGFVADPFLEQFDAITMRIRQPLWSKGIVGWLDVSKDSIGLCADG